MEIKVDEFHWHEAFDRASLMADIFESAICESVAIGEHPRLLRKAQVILEKMVDLYNMIEVERQKFEARNRK